MPAEVTGALRIFSFRLLDPVLAEEPDHSERHGRRRRVDLADGHQLDRGHRVDALAGGPDAVLDSGEFSGKVHVRS
jgi:hypothetical protein